MVELQHHSFHQSFKEHGRHVCVCVCVCVREGFLIRGNSYQVRKNRICLYKLFRVPIHQGENMHIYTHIRILHMYTCIQYDYIYFSPFLHLKYVHA